MAINNPLQREILISLLAERYRPTSLTELEKVLIEAMDEIIVKLAKHDEMTQRLKREALRELSDWLSEIYGELPRWLEEDREYMARLSFENSLAVGALITGEAVAQTLKFDKLPKAAIKIILSDTRSIGSTGLTVADMIEDNKNGQLKRVKQIMAKGIAAKESQSEIIANIKKEFTKTTKNNNDMLVRTVLQDAIQEARHAGYKTFGSAITGYYSTAVLDNRTTPICQSLHLKEYKRKEGQTLEGLRKSIPNKPPRHPRCRSQLLPMYEGYEEDLAELKRPAVLYREGVRKKGLVKKDPDVKFVDADISFSEFFSTLTEKQQSTIVGARKAKLMREGKLTLSDVTKKSRDGVYSYMTNKEIEDVLKDGFYIKAK